MAQTVLDGCVSTVEALTELAAFPVRIQRMITLILAHQEDLCRWHRGCLELHFHTHPTKYGQEENVEAKLSAYLKR